ncbi:hypothetical protein CDS [Bradyrhizobium sp.]|jgi:hypothetical protein|nr:hypothetical protein CDS [Bradyrhizobium sp.]
MSSRPHGKVRLGAIAPKVDQQQIWIWSALPPEAKVSYPAAMQQE